MPQNTSIFVKSKWIVFTLIVSLLFTLIPFQALAAPQDNKAPTAPTNVAAVVVTDTSVSLSWTASKDNKGVAGYYVYTNGALSGTAPGTSFTVTQLAAGTAYTFTVKAYDAANNVSSASAPLIVRTTNSADPGDPPSTKIVGYYAGWATYSGKEVMDLDASKLTHIQYAFANIGNDLRIAVGDPYADIQKMFPGDSASDPYHGNFNQLRKLKQQYPHLKTIISVGGWSWSGKFSDVALTDASRTAFAESVVDFLLQYDFDGVDIDWEYPVSGGMPGNVKRPEDKQNFTLLLQKLRGKLDQQSAIDGKEYSLSIAGAAGSYYANNTELGILQQYLDYILIMAYDIHGTWDTRTGFNAPLYADPNSAYQPDWGVHDAVQVYLNAGVPASKIVMGVPFYGYKYDGVSSANNGLYSTFTGGNSVTYANIKANYLNQGYTRYWNHDSKVPYLFNGSSMISYDDPESIGYKADYIQSQGLGGVMIWELSQDDASRELLNALYNGLQ